MPLVPPGAGLLAAAHPTTGAHSISAWSLLTQLVIGLAVVLAIIYVATRFLSGRTRLAAGLRRQAPITVIARQGMGKGVSVSLVQTGSQVYLLGVTAHHVSRLDQFSADALAAATASEPTEPTLDGGPRPGSLAALVRQLQDRSVRR